MGGSVQGELSKWLWPSPLILILILRSNAMCWALYGVTDAGVRKGVTQRQHLAGGFYTQGRGQAGTPARVDSLPCPAQGLPWESNKTMHRKGLWETSPSRVYAHNGMTVISREHVKQVCNLNSWKPRMLFQKAPWTKPGLQSQPYWLSVVDLWGKTHPRFHFSEVRRRIQISSSALLCAQRLAPVVLPGPLSFLPSGCHPGRHRRETRGWKERGQGISSSLLPILVLQFHLAREGTLSAISPSLGSSK